MYDFLKKHVRVFQRVLVLIFAEAIVVRIHGHREEAGGLQQPHFQRSSMPM